MKNQKILLFGSNSTMCKDLIPELCKSENNKIYCFQRSKLPHLKNKQNNVNYYKLNTKSNIFTNSYKRLFSNWDLAIFFYGDFGTIDSFHKTKFNSWKKTFESNFFLVAKIIQQLIPLSNKKVEPSIINFAGS